MSASREPPPGIDPAQAERAAIDHRSALRAAFDAGARSHAGVALSFEPFARRFASLVLHRLAALSIEPTAERVAASLRAAAGADVFLACACEEGDSAAWTTLTSSLTPRLTGLARRHGASPADADALAADVLGDLARPPPSGGARTVIGTFDGSGSLFHWLAVALVRRIAAVARGRRLESLDARAGGEGSARAARVLAGSSAPDDPAERPADVESAGRFERALVAAWASLTPRERLAMLLRHRDGLAQRRVAVVMGISESRASRLLSDAARRLGEALADQRPADDREWALLRDAVGTGLARLGAQEHPPVVEERERGDSHAT